jgi:hypothetical protein
MMVGRVPTTGNGRIGSVLSEENCLLCPQVPTMWAIESLVTQVKMDNGGSLGVGGEKSGERSARAWSSTVPGTRVTPAACAPGAPQIPGR